MILSLLLTPSFGFETKKRFFVQSKSLSKTDYESIQMDANEFQFTVIAVINHTHINLIEYFSNKENCSQTLSTQRLVKFYAESLMHRLTGHENKKIIKICYHSANKTPSRSKINK